MCVCVCLFFVLYDKHIHCAYIQGDELREKAKRVFRHNKSLLAKCTSGRKPDRMTERKANGDARAVQTGEKLEIDAWWKKKSVYSNYFKKIGVPMPVFLKAFYDLHHGMANVVEDCINIVINKANSTMYFSQSRLKSEQDNLGRFLDFNLKSKRKKPWQSSKKILAQVNKLVMSIRWPLGSSDIRDIREWMRMSEKLKLAGPRGRWLFSLLDIDAEYRDHFIEALDIIWALKKREHHKDEEAEIERRMVQTFAWYVYFHAFFSCFVFTLFSCLLFVHICMYLYRLEVHLPLIWCTITKHMLHESINQVFSVAACWALGLLTIEQYHIVVKKMVYVTFNVVIFSV